MREALHVNIWLRHLQGAAACSCLCFIWDCLGYYLSFFHYHYRLYFIIWLLHLQGIAVCSCLCFIWNCSGLLFFIISLLLSIIFIIWLLYLQGAAVCSCLCFIWDCLGLLFIIISLLLSIIFIGPESDHFLPLSLTNSLTHWLTNSLLFIKLYWCDPGVWRSQLKTCWSCYCCWC